MIFGPALGWVARFFLVKLLGGIGKALLFLLGFIVVRFLALLGFSYVIYKGFDSYGQSILQRVISNFGDLPQFITHMLALAKVDVFLSIIISAYALKFAIRGASKITLFS